MSGFEREEYLSNDNEVLHQQHHDFEPFNDNKQSSVPVAKPKRKRESTLRKAPGAPKRFKSSYILFFMAQRDGIKKELGSKASVSLVDHSVTRILEYRRFSATSPNFLTSR